MIKVQNPYKRFAFFKKESLCYKVNFPILKEAHTEKIKIWKEKYKKRGNQQKLVTKSIETPKKEEKKRPKKR